MQLNHMALRNLTVISPLYMTIIPGSYLLFASPLHVWKLWHDSDFRAYPHPKSLVQEALFYIWSDWNNQIQYIIKKINDSLGKTVTVKVKNCI